MSSIVKIAPWLGLTLLGLIGSGSRPAPVQAQTGPTPTPTPLAIVDWRYGVVESHEAPGHARNLGAAWTRVQFQWATIQAEGPESWTPSLADADLENQLAAGRLVVGLVIGVPDWARDEAGLPAGLYRPPEDPANSWAAFVRQLVGRYRGRIDHWVIWNEPDIWDPTALGHTWDGSVADFARLLQIAYLVARETNPEVVIHLPAFTYFWDANYNREQYLSRLLDVIVADPEAASHNYYFDALTAHLYFNPDLILQVLREFEAIRDDHGIPHKPIWLMETNAPPVDDPAWPVGDVTLSVTLGEQAAFIPQAMAVALAAGSERIAVYKLKDTESDRRANPEPFGLIRLDGTRRPAFDAYRLATEYFAGVQRAEVERWNEVGQIRLEHERILTTVLFSRLPTPQTATVAAAAETAFLVDMFGSRRIILTAENGRFTVDLPPALCSQSIGDYCMIGSTVFYLTQDRRGGPPPGLPVGSPLPPPPTPSVTPPPLPSLTPTVTATSTGTPTSQRVATGSGSTEPPPATATGRPAGGSPAPGSLPAVEPESTATPAASATLVPTLVMPSAQAPLTTVPADVTVWIAGLIGLSATILLLIIIFRRASQP